MSTQVPMSRSTVRTSKLIDLAEAMDVVCDGQLLVLGGLWFHNNPSALAREIVRRRIHNLRIIAAPPSGYAVDLLIGGGCVAEATIGHVSFEHMGLAPNFQRAAQTGAVKIIDADEATILGGFMATLEHLQDHPVTSVRGTDIMSSPIARRNSDGVVAPRAIVPDVCLLHAQEADIYGNVRNFGNSFADPLFAKAARHVIVSVDRIVENSEVRKEPHRTTIPGYLVDRIVCAPGGAHPGSSQGLYPHDETAVKAYIKAGRDTGSWEADYLEPLVHAPGTHEDYLAAIGGWEHLVALNEVVK